MSITDYLADMSDEEKVAFAMEQHKNFPESSAGYRNVINANPLLRDGYPPSRFHSLPYSGAGEFTNNYLYTLCYFLPNQKKEFHISGAAYGSSRFGTTGGMYIELIRKSDRYVMIKSPIYTAGSNIDGTAFIPFDYAIGTLDPNEFYYFRFSPFSADCTYKISLYIE